ncbi:hypothetical protein [Pseudooceanicola sp. MF1-13]|uniref:hypothetical protein n=1 Tax=Pseudooceanicola sp. MF1-13 TaxID=3379095 RepID=UPI0038927517
MTTRASLDCPYLPDCACPGGTTRPECPAVTFTTPTDALTATAFLAELHQLGWLYYPRESAVTGLWMHQLPPAMVADINRNMRATFRHLPDPCATALEMGAMAA